MNDAFGMLHVVATPIGNLEDMSSRAVTVLSSVGLIAAEDTRRTLSLLAAMNVKPPTMVALHDHNESTMIERLINALRVGRSVALVSDAGTPLLCDPGFALVRRCYDLEIPVLPVPGASAMACALSVCPLPAADFSFAGFLPARSGQRRSRLNDLLQSGRPLVFFEAPHRMRDCLTDLKELAGQRRVFVGREMTKRFETYLCDIPEQLIARMDSADQWRGEFVCVLEGTPGSSESVNLEAGKVMSVLCRELAPAQAARLGAELLGMRKSELYDLALTLKQSDDSSR